MPPEGAIAHLFARFPEFLKVSALIDWLEAFPADIWHETRAGDDGMLAVVIQAHDKLNVFALDVHREVDHAAGVLKHLVIRSGPVTPPAGLTGQNAVDSVAAHLDARSGEIVAVRPVVSVEQRAILAWQVDVVKGDHLVRFRFEHQRVSDPRNLGQFPPVARSLHSGGNEALATNEIHHPEAWRALAEEWTKDAVTVHEKAFRIWANVKEKMAYDGTVLGFLRWVWSDKHVIDGFLWTGVCDEWAVVQVSFLRALGIPAVLKWITFIYQKQPLTHAVVEYFDGQRWEHMDALWGAIHQRSYYRGRGCSNVLVMDVCCPTTNGSGRCDPFSEFQLNPAPPGEERPGYSFAPAGEVPEGSVVHVDEIAKDPAHPGLV